MRKKALILLTTICASLCFGAPFSWNYKTIGNGATAELEIAPGYYAYSESIVFSGWEGKIMPPKPEKNADGVEILPAGKWVWHFDGKPNYLSVVYQGCALPEEGDSAAICLLPEKVVLCGGAESENSTAPETLNSYPELFKAKLLRSASGYMDKTQFLAFLKSGETEKSTSQSVEKGFIYMLILAFLGGIALNLTPCVLPLIPINIAIINSGAGDDRKKGFFNGLLYGAGMAIAYGLFGFGVIRFGIKFGDLGGNIYFQLAAAVIFLVLGIAACGKINFDMSWVFRDKKATLRMWKSAGIFLLGALAALLAGACVAPVTVAMLVFAAAEFSAGNYGALFLPLALGIGMGLPWPFFGAGLAILPKPGKFMLYVKYLFGAVLICGALWFFYGAWTIYDNSRITPAAEFAKLQKALVEAKEKNLPLLVDCHASWCASCKKMESSVLSDTEVQNELKNFVFVRFQTEDLHDAGVRFLLDKWQIPGLPGFAVLDSAE